MFKSLKRFFIGTEVKMEKGLQKTPEYWDGILRENEGKLKKCIDAHSKALVKLRVKSDELSLKEKSMIKWEEGSKKAYKKFEQTKDAQYQVLSKEAYFKYKEIKGEIDILKE